MSGDCGHGWGYHSKGPSGPCDKCVEEDKQFEDWFQKNRRELGILQKRKDGGRAAYRLVWDGNGS